MVLSAQLPVVAHVTSVLAHQGGWDEALMVAVPLVVVAWLLRAASRKADTMDAPQPDEGPAEI